MSNCKNNDRGASLVEYALLVALIAVVCIAAVQILGTPQKPNTEPNNPTVESFVPGTEDDYIPLSIEGINAGAGGSSCSADLFSSNLSDHEVAWGAAVGEGCLISRSVKVKLGGQDGEFTAWTPPDAQAGYDAGQGHIEAIAFRIIDPNGDEFVILRTPGD